MSGSPSIIGFPRYRHTAASRYVAPSFRPWKYDGAFSSLGNISLNGGLIDFGIALHVVVQAFRNPLVVQRTYQALHLPQEVRPWPQSGSAPFHCLASHHPPSPAGRFSVAF